MTTDVKETKVTLKDEVLELAKKIEKSIEIDKKSGVATTKGDVYNENLPEGITPEIVKDVSNFNTKFIAAGAYAFGKVAVDAMAHNKSLETSTLEISMGNRDSIGYNVDRKREYTNHLSGNGEKQVKLGVVTASFDVRAGKNGGQLKAARTLIGELASEKLK